LVKGRWLAFDGSRLPAKSGSRLPQSKEALRASAVATDEPEVITAADVSGILVLANEADANVAHLHHRMARLRKVLQSAVDIADEGPEAGEGRQSCRAKASYAGFISVDFMQPVHDIKASSTAASFARPAPVSPGRCLPAFG
jgi:hypothetical protein